MSAFWIECVCRHKESEMSCEFHSMELCAPNHFNYYYYSWIYEYFCSPVSIHSHILLTGNFVTVSSFLKWSKSLWILWLHGTGTVPFFCSAFSWYHLSHFQGYIISRGEYDWLVSDCLGTEKKNCWMNSERKKDYQSHVSDGSSPSAAGDGMCCHIKLLWLMTVPKIIAAILCFHNECNIILSSSFICSLSYFHRKRKRKLTESSIWDQLDFWCLLLQHSLFQTDRFLPVIYLYFMLNQHIFRRHCYFAHLLIVGILHWRNDPFCLYSFVSLCPTEWIYDANVYMYILNMFSFNLMSFVEHSHIL